MSRPSKYLDALVKEFSRLPGIGAKSASRLAFHILKMPTGDVEKLASSIIDLKLNISTCKKCGGISDSDTCSICLDENRDKELVCVVEEARDVLTIEGTGEFKGLYHVLGGLIAPLDGIGPEDLNIEVLVKKCGHNRVKEVILALSPTIEGDATSLYLSKLLSPSKIRVTRIAHGLPVGSDLEFADRATIIKSISGRREV